MKSDERLIFLIIIAILSISLMAFIISDKSEYKEYIDMVIDDHIEEIKNDNYQNSIQDYIDFYNEYPIDEIITFEHESEYDFFELK